MKEIRTIKMVEQTEVKFIAEDGKEFIGENAEQECKTHERRMHEDQVKREFEKLGAVKIDIPMANWYIDEAMFWRVKLNSKKDYLTIQDYFEVVYQLSECYMTEPKEYPYTMTVALGYDYYDEYRSNIKEELQKALDQLNKFEGEE